MRRGAQPGCLTVLQMPVEPHSHWRSAPGIFPWQLAECRGQMTMFNSFLPIIDSLSACQHRFRPRTDVIDAKTVFAQHDRGRR